MRFSKTKINVLVLVCGVLAATIAAQAEPVSVLAHQRISDTQGGFTGSLHDYDGFGFSVASLGDLDGDGIDDLAVGAQNDDDGGVNRDDVDTTSSAPVVTGNLHDPQITVWSCAVHDPGGTQTGPDRLCLPIFDGGWGGWRHGADDPRDDTTIEPRFFGYVGTSPNFNEIDIALDGPAAGAVTVDASCTDGSTPSGSPVTVSTDGLTVTAIFNPALPNRHCCTLTLGGGASGSQVIKMLAGDVNGSGRVNATDKNLVKGAQGAPPLPADEFFFDLNMSGRINATDKNLVKARITGYELDALCP